MYEHVPQKSRYFVNYSISDHFHPMQVTGQSELRLATVRYPQPQDWILCGVFGTKVLISRRNTKVFLSLCGSDMFILHLHEISDIGNTWAIHL